MAVKNLTSIDFSHLRQPVILPAVEPAPAKVQASTSLLSLAKPTSLKSRPHRKVRQSHPD